MIALKQDGAPLEGFMKYVLSNPEPFINETDLFNKIRSLIKDRKWNPKFSRNLIIKEEEFTGPFYYSDHTGTSLQRVYQVRVENQRPDIAAVSTICILHSIQNPQGKDIIPFDRSYLKWARQHGYERTILPKDYGVIDLFAIHADKPGLFLHSLRDTPREPIIKDNGEYKLFYKLFSQGFPLVEFSIKVNLNWSQPSPSKWEENSIASLFLE